jgi:chromosome segregation ATPase
MLRERLEVERHRMQEQGAAMQAEIAELQRRLAAYGAERAGHAEKAVDARNIADAKTRAERLQVEAQVERARARERDVHAEVERTRAQDERRALVDQVEAHERATVELRRAATELDGATAAREKSTRSYAESVERNRKAEADRSNRDNPFGRLDAARREAESSRQAAERAAQFAREAQSAFGQLERAQGGAASSQTDERLGRVEREVKELRKEVRDLGEKIDRLLEMRGERRIY